ncbi:MAG: sensor histidine kinase [Sphingobacteriales bacterium]|nr:sensor histidine kinase [Sphingobacteriales bacterium]MBI3720646.1 sensor histidine kinase [Sphingobacteriales bacterium]
MFNIKNLSPNQVAAITAMAISIIAGLADFVFIHNWIIASLSFVALFGISYFLIRYFLERFIYRKIKLIYKFIYQTKATKREEFYYKNILPQKGIDEVREDVEKWAEQRKAEIELLKQNEQFRREFLQNLSHEFKTPIFAIQGYVDTLLGGALNNPEVNKRFLENASRNIQRLANLVGDLDEISRLESGSQPIHKTEFIIQELISEVFESLSIKAEKANISTLFKKGCETPPVTVFADKEKIRQVLINLIHNAIKYGKSGGEIEASIYRLDGERILIEISDDGHGIAEEHLPRIFERFYRTDLARSRKEGGSGLGLAICKHIIEAHGHNIHVRSKIDVGTTFGFTLDAKEK